MEKGSLSGTGVEEREFGTVGLGDSSLDGLPDPDAMLSEEERAAIVRIVIPFSVLRLLTDSTHTQDKKLVSKLDMKLIPWLTLLYLLCFLGNNLLPRSLAGRAADCL